jgi:hypothetical protein
MPRSGGFFYRILIWSYERGTIPYDVICVLILAFVFLTPRSCFDRKPARHVPVASSGAPSTR